MVVKHISVMRQRCIDLLAPALQGPDAIMVDATLGLGGHTEAALEAFPQLRVIAFDRDPNAIAESRERLAKFGDRVTFVHAVYDQIETELASLGITQVNGILFDLGVSSMQLDEDERGFSYSRNAPLDMRMDQTVGITAAEIVNTYSHGELARILNFYGEERFASRIASAIVKERAITPFDTSDRLVDVVRDAIPAATRRTGGNPAKRTFQALRIEVNDELGVLERAIPAALNVLALHGRIVVMSFQSLEDKIVKKAFRVGSESTAPVDMPIMLESQKPWLSLLTRGSEQATPDEIEENSRAQSVRLRAAERIGVAA